MLNRRRFLLTSAAAAAATVAGKLVHTGVIVLSMDVRGMGETKIASDLNDSESYRYFGDYEDGMTAILMNRTLAGMRAGDIIRGLDMLAALRFHEVVYVSTRSGCPKRAGLAIKKTILHKYSANSSKTPVTNKHNQPITSCTGFFGAVS